MKSAAPAPLAAVLAALLLAPGCGISFDTSPLVKETRNLGVYHDPAAGLRVQTRNGSVEVLPGAARDAGITAEVRAKTKERLQGVRVVAEHDSDGTLVVGVEWPGEGRQDREGCSFIIELPGAGPVDLASHNGSLKVTEMAGPARLETRNGGITVVGHEGPVDAETRNGQIVVKGVVGSVRARTRNGALKMEDVSGEVRARTTNGSVRLDLGRLSSGPLDVQSSNGSVRIDMGPGLRGTLEVEASNGSLSVEPPPGARYEKTGKRSGLLHTGRPGPASRVLTTNGSLHVRFPGGLSEDLPAEAEGESWDYNPGS